METVGTKHKYFKIKFLSKVPYLSGGGGGWSLRLPGTDGFKESDHMAAEVPLPLLKRCVEKQRGVLSTHCWNLHVLLEEDQNCGRNKKEKLLTGIQTAKNVEVFFSSHHLEYDQIGGCCVQVLSHETFLKKVFGVSHSSKQVVPQGIFSLSGTVNNGLQKQGELGDEFGHSGQQRIRDGLPRCGLFLKYDVHHQLHDMREIGEGGT